MNVKPHINFKKSSCGFKNVIKRIKNLFDALKVCTVNESIINKNCDYGLWFCDENINTRICGSCLQLVYGKNLTKFAIPNA
jgi:hypothetical protein